MDKVLLKKQLMQNLNRLYYFFMLMVLKVKEILLH